MKVRVRHLCLAILLIVIALVIASDLKAQNFHTYPEQRSVKDQGFGPVINDLETHARKGHPMRNESDPGNWVHELTHQVNSDIRCATKANDNAFYVMDGNYFILVEPKVTLRQVATLVPKSERGMFYKTYLVEQQRWWNNEPLYVLDEATAFSNSILYHAMSGTKDATRVQAVQEFKVYVQALVKAVKKHDPKYTQLAELEEFVVWCDKRASTLLGLYNGDRVITPVKPDKIPYHFFKRGK